MRLADKGDHVVLAMRVKLDVAQHDDVVIARHFIKGARQHILGVLAIACEELIIGAGNPARRLAQALAVGIVARIGDERADSLLGLLARGADDARCTGMLGLRPGRQFLNRGVHELRLPCMINAQRLGAVAASIDAASTPSVAGSASGLSFRGRAAYIMRDFGLQGEPSRF
jgi:hypothetical protein